MLTSLPLLIIFLIGVVTKNNLLASASGILMVLGLMRLQRFLPLIERRGVELGLLFLTMSILVPIASGKVTLENMVSSLFTPVGMLAIVGGIVGAYLNSQGYDLLTITPEIIPGILIGVIVCVSFFDGIPVGPIMAAGITALLVRLFLG